MTCIHIIDHNLFGYQLISFLANFDINIPKGMLSYLLAFVNLYDGYDRGSCILHNITKYWQQNDQLWSSSCIDLLFANIFAITTKKKYLDHKQVRKIVNNFDLLHADKSAFTIK